MTYILWPPSRSSSRSREYNFFLYIYIFSSFLERETSPPFSF